MSADVYGSQLQTIADILQRAGFTACIRGEGTARFVYAEHGVRAAELSHNGAGFFVELFEQPHAVSMRDYQQDTPELAADDALEWFSSDTRNA